MAKLLLYLALLLPGVVAAQSCTTTGITTCAGVQSCVSTNTGTEKVCCVNNGASIGACSLANYARTAFATVCANNGADACATTRAASITPSPSNSDFIRIKGFNVGSFSITSCSTNLEFVNLTVAPNGDGVLLDGSSCPTTVQNITFDDVIFDDVGLATFEGRLSLRDSNTVTIKNSQFTGVWQTSGGPSDGIQGVGGIRNLTIGPNNLFQDISQSVCDSFGGAHCDAIQLFGGPCTNILIEGNYFRDSSSLILTESACAGTVQNNVWDTVTTVQFHQWDPLVFEHNTLYNTSVAMNGTATDPATATIRSNILHNSSIDTSDYDAGGPGAACSSCTFDYNLYTSGCTGTNCITGTPTYTGGAPTGITALSGWQLAAGSAGENNGHDGLDRGTLYYGPAAAGPSAPANFRLVRPFPWPLIVTER